MRTQELQQSRNDKPKRLKDTACWTCRGLVLVPVLACYAAFCSKVTGLLYPSAEWRRRGL